MSALPGVTQEMFKDISIMARNDLVPYGILKLERYIAGLMKSTFYAVLKFHRLSYCSSGLSGNFNLKIYKLFYKFKSV